MDDAMILSCGHSFGGGGMQHVTRMVSSQKIPLNMIISVTLLKVIHNFW